VPARGEVAHQGMPKLHVILGSTRPGRQGASIANWFVDVAKKHAGFEVQLVDLAEVALPLLDEPHHPRLKKYEHAHTKKWSATVSAADAFVFVAPEYNHGTSPALLNAIDYLVSEWGYKAAGFVSYGGVSAGLRSVQSLKPILTGLKIVVVPESVAIPFFTQHIEDGVFRKDTDALDKAALVMLDELAKWTPALATLRT